MKLTKYLKSLENAAIEQEVRIAEMNSRLCELQAGLLTRDQSLAAIQADIVHCDSALVASRGTLAEKIRQRHTERRKFTDSIWWKAASPVRAPSSALKKLRPEHLRNLVIPTAVKRF